MKKDIHPKIYKECVVKCACGNTFKTVSSLPEINVEICSECHPFYTGERRFIDTERRIDKFTKRQELAQKKMEKVAEAKKAKKGKKTSSTQDTPLTLKEMLKKAKAEAKTNKEIPDTAGAKKADGKSETPEKSTETKK